MFACFNARAVGLATLGTESTIHLAASAGFKGVDLMVRDIVLRGEDPATIRSLLDDRGLKAGAFPFPIDWRKNEASFLRDFETLPPLLEAARVLGLARTGTWVMPESPDRGMTRSEMVDLHVTRLGRIARLLNDFGIRVGLEVIGVESFRSGRGERFVTRLGDLDPKLGTIWDESPNLGILLDAFHLYASGEPIEAGLAWGVEQIVWVHVADLPPGANLDRTTIIDANRGLPGENGAIDLRNFLARLLREGYKGPVTVEPLANCSSLRGLGPTETVMLVKQALDRVWPDAEAG
jgi:sugar phosphate isomerase/epimerase